MSMGGGHRAVWWCAWAEILEAASMLQLPGIGEGKPSHTPLGTERAALPCMGPDRRHVSGATPGASEKGRLLLLSPAAWHWVTEASPRMVVEEKRAGLCQPSSQGMGLWGSRKPEAPKERLPLTLLLALPELLWHMPGPSRISAASGNKRPGQWELLDSPDQPPKVSMGSWGFPVGYLPSRLSG